MDLAQSESFVEWCSMSKLSDHLWNNNFIPQGQPASPETQKIILDQYKLYVEMADKVSARRDIANAFFLTINGAILSAGPAIVERGITFQNKAFFLFPYCVLVLQLYFWRRLIVSYKQLNGAKFQVVGAMEEHLPAYAYGKAEWEFLLKSGKDKGIYWPLTHIETKIPGLFFIGYTIALISFLCT